MPHMTRALRAPLCTALALAVATACGRNDDRADNTAVATTPAPEVTTSASGGAVSTADATNVIDVESLTLGRAVGPDNKVTDEADDFRPSDTIFAVLETDDDDAANQQLTARWTYGRDNQVVSEQTQTVAGGDDARTVFQLAKPSGWPTGNYRIQILHNGREIKTANFEVKN